MRSPSAVLVILSGAIAIAASPAHAQDTGNDTPSHAAAVEPAAQAPAEPIKISGSVALVSDYRFRGVSQSDRHLAVQGGLTVAHESGFYVGIWGSNLAGWGTFGGANLELDLIGGYKKTFGNTTIDGGLLWYVYPGGANKTDFAEPYLRVSGTRGPLTLTAGVAYAPKQQALGRYYDTGAAYLTGIPDHPGRKDSNLYLSGDGAYAIGGTPFTAKAHIGYSDGNRGLGPNGTSVAPTGKYWDWGAGVDTTYKNLTLGLSYVDTDISRRESAYLQPSFSKGNDGTGSIANGTLLVALTAAF